jgi:hypothetical protein
MKLQNVDRILLFRETDAGRVLTLEELKSKYGLDPDGTNFYYGINQANVDNFAATGSALNPTHQAFFAQLAGSLRSSQDDEKTLVLGLEPNEPVDPYGFVAGHADLVRQLATDLNGVQQETRAAGKRLNILIRYASEMNDRGQKWGGNPGGFKATFLQARSAFQQAAPSVLFSFSPALRADLDEALIAQYWPGDQQVDVIGGTWYIGAPGQRAASMANMRAYFLHRTGVGKPFGLSEVGGHDATGKANDSVLADMFHEIATLQLQNVSFKYLTIFLQGAWGSDATLGFMRA